MLEKLLEDPVATYAAALSTVTAAAGVATAVYKWATSGPQAWVGILNPQEVAALGHKTIEIIVSNVGAEPFVIKEVVVTFHKAKGAEPYHTSRFYHGSSFDPSMETIPNPNGKPNNYVKVAKILKPGDEVHHHLGPASSYDPVSDWLQAQVFLRQKRSPVSAWAAPIKKPAVSPEDDQKK